MHLCRERVHLIALAVQRISATDSFPRHLSQELVPSGCAQYFGGGGGNGGGGPGEITAGSSRQRQMLLWLMMLRRRYVGGVDQFPRDNVPVHPIFLQDVPGGPSLESVLYKVPYNVSLQFRRIRPKKSLHSR